jgi:monofunctional glycosyltransferase
VSGIRLLKLLVWLTGLFLLWFIPWVFVFYTGVVVYFPYEADGQTRYLRVTGPLLQKITAKAAWASAHSITRNCRYALVAAEDMRFYEHKGVDLNSIELAMKRNRKRGKIRWGGSTITQQLVKNVFLSRDRSYLRKSREFIGALFLDLIMSKEEQITWYFNVVEFGPHIYGIQDATQRFFKKKPQNLTLSQCVALVSILPDPKRTYKYLISGALPNYMQKRQERTRRMISNVRINATQAQSKN